MIKWIGAVLVVLFGFAVWKTHQAATTVPRCPTVDELDGIGRDILSGKTDLVDAENLAKSYDAVPGCGAAASSIRSAIAVKKATGTSTKTPTSLPPGTFHLAPTSPTVPDAWSKYEDAFVNDPSVVGLEKIWRDRVVFYLYKDPRTLSADDLANAKTLYATLQKLNAGWVTEVLRRYIALADPSYGQAGDPVVFPTAPVTPIFPVDTATGALLLRREVAA